MTTNFMKKLKMATGTGLSREKCLHLHHQALTNTIVMGLEYELLMTMHLFLKDLE